MEPPSSLFRSKTSIIVPENTQVVSCVVCASASCRVKVETEDSKSSKREKQIEEIRNLLSLTNLVIYLQFVIRLSELNEIESNRKNFHNISSELPKLNIKEKLFDVVQNLDKTNKRKQFQSANSIWKEHARFFTDLNPNDFIKMDVKDIFPMLMITM